MNSNKINAKMLAKMFLAGAKNLEVKKEWINELNVFPVPDGDTGTNMTLTIMSAAKEVAGLDERTGPQLQTPSQFHPLPDYPYHRHTNLKSLEQVQETSETIHQGRHSIRPSLGMRARLATKDESTPPLRPRTAPHPQE